MKKIWITFGILILFNLNHSFAQEACKVIPENLQGEYNGKCKNGLAQGKGEAKGIDHYIGKFKAGFPHGKGVYTYKNGDQYEGFFNQGLKDGDGKFIFKYDGKDSIQEGYFKKDVYMGPKPKPDYVIKRNLNIPRITVNKVSDAAYENKVSFKILRDGNVAPYYNFFMFNSEGINETNANWQIIRSYTVPLKVRITYDIRTRLQTSSSSCELEIIINNPGIYEVLILN